MLVSVVSFVVLASVLYFCRPRTILSNRDALRWLEWGKRLSILQTMAVLGILQFLETVPYVLNGSFWRGMTLTGFLFNPFDRLPEADIFSQAYVIGSILLPLFFASLVHLRLVKPLYLGRNPDTKTFHSVFSAGLLLATFVVIVASGLAYMYGMHLLYIITPVFAGLFITGVFLTRLASVHYIPSPHQLRS